MPNFQHFQLIHNWTIVTMPMMRIKNKDNLRNFDWGIKTSIFFPIKEPSKPMINKKGTYFKSCLWI